MTCTINRHKCNRWDFMTCYVLSRSLPFHHHLVSLFAVAAEEWGAQEERLLGESTTQTKEAGSHWDRLSTSQVRPSQPDQKGSAESPRWQSGSRCQGIRILNLSQQRCNVAKQIVQLAFNFRIHSGQMTFLRSSKLRSKAEKKDR